MNGRKDKNNYGREFKKVARRGLEMSSKKKETLQLNNPEGIKHLVEQRPSCK
jgi:hypothetical protein